MLLQQSSSSSSHKPSSRSSTERRRRQTSLMAGLKLLTQPNNISQAKPSMVVSKKKKKPAFYFSRDSQTQAQSRYNLLHNCHLCGHKLRPDKDVFMYKGDQGFCSVECRSRQMGLDEMREIEASTRQALVSNRHCHHHHHTHKSKTNQIVHSPITHRIFVLWMNE